jgi:hypothetical protein
VQLSLRKPESVAAITKFEKDEALKKKRDASTELALISGPAMVKLAAKNGNVEKLTMKEIYSILLASYGLIVDDKKYKWPALVLILRSKIDESPANVAVSPVAAPNALPDPAATAASTEAAVADSSSSIVK